MIFFTLYLASLSQIVIYNVNGMISTLRRYNTVHLEFHILYVHIVITYCKQLIFIQVLITSISAVTDEITGLDIILFYYYWSARKEPPF